MAKINACDFEGTGPAGTTLTNANTGNVVAIGVGCTAVSTASAAYGSFAGSFTVPATNVASRVTVPITSGLRFAVSFKFRIPTGFAILKRILLLQNATFGSILSVNYNGTVNRVQVQNAGGSSPMTLAVTLALDTWYRVEVVCAVNASSAPDGFYRMRLFDNEGTTPLGTLTSSTYNMGTTAPFQAVVGINTNSTSVVAAVDIDSVRYEAGRESDLGPEALTTITSDLDSRYRVLGQVQSDLDARWAVRGSVSSDVDLRHRIRNLVSGDLDLRYRLLGRVESDLDSRWRLRGIATSDIDLRHRIRNLVTSDLDSRWQVKAAPRDITVVAGLAEQGRVSTTLADPSRITATLGAQDG